VLRGAAMLVGQASCSPRVNILARIDGHEHTV
jgi:hypothetical protein